MNCTKRVTRVSVSDQGVRAGGDSALESAENEGWPTQVPARTKRLAFTGKIARYFRGEYAFPTASSDIALEQLYRKLMLADAKDTRVRKRFHEMMYVMSSDLRAEKESPLPGLPTGLARPMSARPHEPLKSWLPQAISGITTVPRYGHL